MSQPLLEAGRVIAARYRIDKAIGRGGYGTVYCATRLEDDLPVALKLMHRRHVANPQKIKRFQREAALVTRLRHLNVVTTLDYGHTDDGIPFIVFELLRGHSLKYRLKGEGALSYTRACQITIQVLRALVAAHALDIAHRDIKPANIYLCAGRDDDFVKVLDFGIAKALVDREDKPTTQLTAVGQLLGTPTYMSPEQIKAIDVGLTCDLYSLGLVMSELLTGRKLVTGANEQMIFLKHLSSDPHTLSEAVMETPLGRVIEKAIRKDPAARFASAKEMLAAVEVVAAAERFGAASRRGDSVAASRRGDSVAASRRGDSVAASRRGDSVAASVISGAAGEASPLSGLLATVRTEEPEDDGPPPSSLAGLMQTVRTAESLDDNPPDLATLQETVRMDPNVSVDEILRRHRERTAGSSAPPAGVPLDGKTVVVEEDVGATVPVEDVMLPTPTAPAVGPPIGVDPPQGVASPAPTGQPIDEGSSAPLAQQAAGGRAVHFILPLVVVLAAAAAGIAYWFFYVPVGP